MIYVAAFYIYSLSVGGAYLTRILERGVQPNMDKALALLKKKKACAAKSVCGLGSRSEPRPETAALEVQDDSDAARELKCKRSERMGTSSYRHHSKRHDRGHHSTKHGGGSGHQTIAEVSVDRSPIFSSLLRNAELVVVRVDVPQTERWTVDNKPSLYSLQVFHLPQDTDAYVGHSRSDLASRARARPGRVRFLSLRNITCFIIAINHVFISLSFFLFCLFCSFFLTLAELWLPMRTTLMLLLELNWRLN